ncbi:hypothetical protein V5O48_017518 [Marasmius crinis-equi]|uniref:Tyr recombinase domain-containing protein n=1 Tax=Marasmius crinis-equi TaxID=585013 RepID=A0ABR3ENQ7_9AGAR
MPKVKDDSKKKAGQKGKHSGKASNKKSNIVDLSATGGAKMEAKGRQKKVECSATASELNSAASQSKDQWGMSGKTRKGYDGAVSYVMRWHTAFCDSRADMHASGNPPDDGIDEDLLRTALQNPPNRYSSQVLEWFLVSKCIKENHPKSGDRYYSAMVERWDKMDTHGKFIGTYKFEEETGIVTGNPARAPSVQDLMTSIRNTVRSDSTTRNHAEAMSYQDMEKWMAWSEKMVPDALADHPELLATREKLLEVGKHLMMRAFAASGFTLWTRNFELCQLRRRHLTLDCSTSVETGSLPFDRVNLKGRKGWMAKAGFGDDPATAGHIYDIFDQPNLPPIDMRPKLRRWISFLENVLLKRPLEPDDFIFPYMSSNGTVDSQRPMLYDAVQKDINHFASCAGLKPHFTTHSFRRGGAQFRFMHAGLGKCWSLARVRWWGGWAEGEKVDTLIRYLLDELQRYELAHNDALCPVPSDRHSLFLGQHQDVEPASQGHLKAIGNMVETRLQTLETAIHSMFLTAQRWPNLFYPPPFPSSSISGAFSTSTVPAPLPFPLLPAPSTSIQLAASAGVVPPFPDSIPLTPTQNSSAPPPVSFTVSGSMSDPQTHTQSQVFISVPNPNSKSSPNRTRNSRRALTTPTTPGRVIRDIKARGGKAWREAVD